MHVKGAASGSTIQAFQGLEMGVLAPHPEHVRMTHTEHSHSHMLHARRGCAPLLVCTLDCCVASSWTADDAFCRFALSAHVRVLCTVQGPTRPELRIGNLVIQGRLVQLPKPLLVLTTRRLREEQGEGSAAGGVVQSQSQKDGARSPLGGSASKRKRGDTGDGEGDGDGGKKARSSDGSASSASSASSPSSTFPSACLQTVAIIRHKYTFTHRPYAICDMGTAAPTQTAAKQEAKTHTTPSKAK